MAQPDQPRKNVLFILIDQLRADCLTGALAEHVELPNLRAFMETAVTFQRNYTVVNPCGPSRASILTGQYAMNHRSVRNGTPLRHDAPTLAGEMRKAGYLPMLFGYTDTSRDPRVHHPNDPAVQTYEYHMADFHEMLEMRLEMSYPWRSHLMNRGYTFDDYWDLYKPVSPTGGAPRLNDPAPYRAEDSDTAFLTDRFLATMPAYGDQSWFAHLTYIRPHPPLVAPAPYNDMYDPAALPLPNRLADAEAERALHPFFGPAIDAVTPASTVLGFPDLGADDDVVQTLRAIYLGLASEVDAHIGRVLQFLKDSGQEDNTLVIISADHGEMLGDRHSWGKFSVYDAAYQTPLIVRLPGNGARAGSGVQEITESIDLTPTILDWVGQEIPNAMDGTSLLPLLRGEAPTDWRRYSYSELDFADPATTGAGAFGIRPSEASLAILRDERFTLVEFAADLPPILFDHQGAGEMENVAGDPALQADLARLTRTMLRHRMRNADHTLSLHEITTNGPRAHRRQRPGG
ncbi:sulfatase-like hydrolase/transferase [Phaeobacter gallaeciensis]|uniref:sulfatase-like hydrolase/transferase n=1 Tax=Phaeobacter gallaeciensis TaxID=60890 RepID=UPI00237F01B6|nr:sulfatase-like hydrolase/transferase [Phaeobacter gallaeciensis]MDE4192311.1 sulfatase-like hydrolase/transferase [Phaeobacter gallaeciensis]MDE4200744.1 sulfatase-like hydrolase/transferase [Phaeobacter gallaeciensis]MDE4204927.1 sulfatase-like hydrolase/transferase [Phaeobacter gallaeciensis]MDE4209066.1 sulfatase-like hydrolase/transferase [Phaeobacter gallaeciensis]MDE4217434.1 sulfatase-like hydrolase/transferase [Phaeobacter gallaeciensis]